MALQVGDLNEDGERVVELFAGFIPVTAEGKARARKKLDDARSRMTPEKWAAMRAKIGMSPIPKSATRRYPDPMEQDVVTVPVDLEDPELKAALAADLPTSEKGARVRSVLTRMGATLLDLRDAQRGIARRGMTEQQRAAYEEKNRQAQTEAARLYGVQ